MQADLCLCCSHVAKTGFLMPWVNFFLSEPESGPYHLSLPQVSSRLVFLTHICLVDLSINWTSPFPILGVSGVLFHTCLFSIIVVGQYVICDIN